MKVLHVIPSVSLAHGGPSVAIRSFARALTAEGVALTILTTDNNGPTLRYASHSPPAFDRTDAQIVVCPQTIEPYKVSLKARQWMRANVRGFDLIHTHALFSYLPTIAALEARRAGKPYVVRPLGTLGSYGTSSQASLLKRLWLHYIDAPIVERAQVVHCTSNAEADDVQRVVPSANVEVIPLAVDCMQPPTREARELLPRLNSRVILYCGRLHRKKNVELLLRSFAQILRTDANVSLLIAGAGESAYVASLKSLAEALGVHERVVWVGHVEGETKAAAFSVANVFALTSHEENFGIAVAEALAAGLPCVLTRGVALADEVMTAGAGAVVSDDPGEIAQQLSRFLLDAGLRESAIRAARVLAESKFSERELGRALVAMYRRCLDKSGRHDLADANQRTGESL